MSGHNGFPKVTFVFITITFGLLLFTGKGQNDNYPRQHIAIDKSPQNIGATLKFRFEIYNIYILH